MNPAGGGTERSPAQHGALAKPVLTAAAPSSPLEDRGERAADPVPAGLTPRSTRSWSTVAELDAAVADCRSCPRLVAWRELVAREKRAAYRAETYWGRAVPGFGPPDASLLIVGLAPAAHGANRTGRMFTGDRSGDVLYAALHAVGLATQPSSTHVGDGLALRGTRITAPVHCAPPDNRPTPAERDACGAWLRAELALLAPTVRAVVVLGGFGWQALLPVLAGAGWTVPRPRPRFGHGVHVELAPAAPTGRVPAAPTPRPLHVFGSYHVSQQNTFTGRLTPDMLEDVLRVAALAAGLIDAQAEAST